MAYNAFLKFTPELKGEAEDTDFKGQIEIYSFSWGVMNPTTVAAGGGSSAGKAEISSFNIMKKLDLSSPSLFQKCCAGKHFDKAEVTLCKQSGTDNPLQFLVMKFEEVFVNSLQWSGSSGGDETPTESLSFSFAQVTFTYKQQAKEGTEGASPGAGWNMRKNAAAGGK